MRDTQRLGAAKQSLTSALNRSTHAQDPNDADGRVAQQHVFGAELKLRQGGRPDLARRLEAALCGDVTTSEARTELREVAQKLDAELDPDVSTSAFVVASDGGSRRDAECPDCDDQLGSYDPVQEQYRCYVCGAGWDENGRVGGGDGE